jgi:hypothetical protein
VKFKLLYEAYKEQRAKSNTAAASGRKKTTDADSAKEKQEKQSM